MLETITGSAYIVWFLRALEAKIGKNCAIYAEGKPGLMTEPDLVQVCVTCANLQGDWLTQYDTRPAW